MLNSVYVANITETAPNTKQKSNKKSPDMIEGMIYKSSKPGIQIKSSVKTWLDYTNINQLLDIVR